MVLPLLLTEAYHSDTDLPAVLHDAHRRLPWLRISYGRPLGPHAGLLHALDRRLAEAGMPAAPQDTAVVLAAAGSSRPAANAAVACVAAAWRAARGWRAVVPAYASAASPTPGEAVAVLRQAGERPGGRRDLPAGARGVHGPGPAGLAGRRGHGRLGRARGPPRSLT